MEVQRLMGLLFFQRWPAFFGHLMVVALWSIRAGVLLAVRLLAVGVRSVPPGKRLEMERLITEQGSGPEAIRWLDLTGA